MGGDDLTAEERDDPRDADHLRIQNRGLHNRRQLTQWEVTTPQRKGETMPEMPATSAHRDQGYVMEGL